MGNTMVTPQEPPSPNLNRRKQPRRNEDRRLWRRDRELHAARRITEALFQRLTTEDALRMALQTALEVVNAECGSILLADSKLKQLVFHHSIGASPVPAGTAMPWDQGIAGKVFHTGQSLIIPDASADPSHYSEVDRLTCYVTRDMIALPLKRWEGAPIGILEVLNKREGRLGEDDVAILTIVSAVAATSIEQARLFEESKLAEVARLLGNISHDIKNLLIPVVCGIGLLEGEISDALSASSNSLHGKAKASFAACAKVTKVLRRSARRIQDRVKEIADCVKGLSAKLRFEPCDLSGVVESVFETLHWLAEERNIRLMSKELHHLPRIHADEGRLFTALYNLVNNSILASDSGGSVTICGNEECDTKSIILTVTDTGRGMSAEIRDSLFTAHVRSTQKGGTGLGTKIVKDIVDAHHGDITVESQEGVGTTFSIRLPCNQRVAS
jgi:signal transduction histidine kinase